MPFYSVEIGLDSFHHLEILENSSLKVSIPLNAVDATQRNKIVLDQCMGLNINVLLTNSRIVIFSCTIIHNFFPLFMYERIHILFSFFEVMSDSCWLFILSITFILFWLLKQNIRWQHFKKECWLSLPPPPPPPILCPTLSKSDMVDVTLFLL